MHGDAIPDLDMRGERVVDDSFILFFSAHHEPIDFTLPDGYGEGWQVVVSDVDADELARTATALGAHAVVADVATEEGVGA